MLRNFIIPTIPIRITKGPTIYKLTRAIRFIITPPVV
jgi:hypothetical protein